MVTDKKIKVTSKTVLKRKARNVEVRGKEYRIKPTWMYRIRYTANGLETSKEKGGFATKREATAAMTAEANKLTATRGRSLESERRDFNWLVGEAEKIWLKKADYKQHSTKGRVKTFGYKSFKTMMSQTRRLQSHFGAMPLEDLSLGSIVDFKRAREKDSVKDKDGQPLRPVSAATVNRELAMLRRFLRWGSRKGWCENPFDDAFQVEDIGEKLIDVAAEETRGDIILSEADEERLLACCVGTYEKIYSRVRFGKKEELTASYEVNHVFLRALIAVAVDTGIRLSELKSIRWKDIDAASNTVLIRAGYAKTGKERRTVITSRGLDALDSIREIAPAEGPFTEIGDTKRAWNSVRERAALSDIRFHDLRGTFATRLAAAGVSELIIMQLMGHSPTTVTRRHYIGLDASIIADTVEKIEAWRNRLKDLPVTSDAIALSAAVN